MAAATESQGAVDFRLSSGQQSVLELAMPILHVRIGIDPSDAASKDDKFKLYSSDGTYEKTLTVKDDKVDGDEYVDLVFDRLKVGRSYTLEVNPGAQGDPYNLFEEEPYEEIIAYYSVPEPDDELEEDDEVEDEQGTPDEGLDWDDETDGGGEFGGDVDFDDSQMETIFEEEEEEPEDDELDWDAIDPTRPLDLDVTANDLDRVDEEEDGWNDSAFTWDED